MANKPTAQLVPRGLFMVAAVTILWMTFSHLHPQIGSTILGRNLIMMLRGTAKIQEAFRWRKLASNCLNRNFKTELTDSSDTLQSSETVLWASLPTMSKELLLMSRWLRYASTVTLWMLPLQAFWLVGSVQGATQLRISRCEYGCTGWSVIEEFVLWVRMFLALWRADRWVIIWSFLVRFWVSFCWCVYFIITSFIFIHKGLCWEFTMLGLIIEKFVFGKGIVAAIGLGVWLWCNW